MISSRHQIQVCTVLGFLLTTVTFAATKVSSEGGNVNRLVIHVDQGKNTIAPEIYGHFAEHLGRCVYEGFWVGEDSSIPNVRGIRKDVVEALKKQEALKSLALGNAADAKHWKQRADDLEGVFKHILKGNPRCKSSSQLFSWARSLAVAAISTEEKTVVDVNIRVTQVIRVTVDESKFTEAFMATFRESHYNFTTIEEHQKHLGQLYARGMIDNHSFSDGYGWVMKMGIKFITVSGEEEKEI